jgi:phosphoribosylaminoimidazole-succinocarboxamide synthase
VRAYLAGSAGRDYEAGRPVSGIALPPGLRSGSPLPAVMLTPSTKAEKGAHDMPISEDEIVKRGIVPKARWAEVRECALALFKRGQAEADSRGLILVDTKYEFGIDPAGKLLLVDEIHTLDSSRYWVKATYRERFERRETPEMLDKEPIRQWLIKQGYQGEGTPPEITAEKRLEIARHYLGSYRTVTGAELAVVPGAPEGRIERALNAYRISTGAAQNAGA